MRRLAAALAALLFLAACSGGGKKHASSTSSATTASTAASTTAAPSNIAPLTGLPGDPAKLSRPLLVVKIDNAPEARPQAGINQADVVVEEGVEGGVTRFASLFHSEDADPLGPVRSARTTDINFATALNHPLFGYSGANADFEKLLDASPLVNVGPGKFPGGYHRQSGRKAPYNLFSSTPVLRSRTPAGAGPPPALFKYGTPTASGAPSAGVHMEWHGNVTSIADWTWDASGGVWRRSENGSAHVDAAGQQVTATNLVIEFVNYKDTGYKDRAGSPVPEAQLIGEGDVWVLTNGQVYKGRWQKPSVDAITTFTGSDGKPLLLKPGRTWLELPVPGLAQLH